MTYRRRLTYLCTIMIIWSVCYMLSVYTYNDNIGYIIRRTYFFQSIASFLRYKEIHKSYTSLHYQFLPPLKKPNTMALMCLLLNRLIQTKSIVDFSANSLSTFYHLTIPSKLALHLQRLEQIHIVK